MTVNNTEEMKEDKDADWVTPWVNYNFTCPGLEAHNRSIGWLTKAAKEIGATIDSKNPRHHDSAECIFFEIGIQGRESGAKYNIVVEYYPRRAEQLASRIEEIMGANDGYPVNKLVLRGFLRIVEYMTFNVYTIDDKDGTWDHICIEPGKGDGIWPGDDIHAVMLCLHDDMTTAIEPCMYTLRKSLYRTSRLSYLAGRSTICIHRLNAYLRAYKEIGDWVDESGVDKQERIAGKYRSKFSDPQYAISAPANASEDDFEDSEDEDGCDFEGLGSLFG